MRFADIVFRRGHLSEQSLIEAVLAGDRPAHLERCDICAERAVELGRWLDQVRAAGIDAADRAFPAERLVAQQQQIMRRLEQLDTPTRVIAFPSQPVFAREQGGRRVAAGWVAVAAAAGLVVGVVSSQATERLTSRPAPAPVTSVAPAPPQVTPETATEVASIPVPEATIALNPSLIEELDRAVPTSFQAMANLTPRQARGERVSLTAGGGR